MTKLFNQNGAVSFVTDCESVDDFMSEFAVELLRYLSLPENEGANKYDVMSVVKSFLDNAYSICLKLDGYYQEGDLRINTSIKTKRIVYTGELQY